MKVVPAPLNYTVDEFINQFKKLSIYFDTFQIDVQDGKYINNKTISLEEYLQAFKMVDQSKIKSSTFDFHLQTISFEQETKLLSTVKNSINIGNILIHYSLLPNIIKLKELYPDFSFGLVLNPEDSVDDLTKHFTFDALPSIQIMSIHPGPQGSPFIPETLNKIDQLCQKNYRNNILLDGAVNQATIPQILSKKNKPDVLCIGSFLTKAEDKLKERVEYLREIIK